MFKYVANDTLEAATFKACFKEDTMGHVKCQACGTKCAESDLCSQGEGRALRTMGRLLYRTSIGQV